MEIEKDLGRFSCSQSKYSSCFLVLLVLASLSACVHYRDKNDFLPLPGVDFKYEYEDEVQEKRIRVSLISLSRRKICVGREGWPYEEGLYTDSPFSSGVYLIVGDAIHIYPSTEILGYCGNEDCFRPVSYGQKIDGYFEYSEFKIDPHSLEYKRGRSKFCVSRSTLTRFACWPLFSERGKPTQKTAAHI